MQLSKIPIHPTLSGVFTLFDRDGLRLVSEFQRFEKSHGFLKTVSGLRWGFENRSNGLRKFENL